MQGAKSANSELFIRRGGCNEAEMEKNGQIGGFYFVNVPYILWVTNIDDVDERYNNFGQLWGERKMGDIIRRYSTYGQ